MFSGDPGGEMEASVLIRKAETAAYPPCGRRSVGNRASGFLLLVAAVLLPAILGGCGNGVVYVDAVRGNYAHQQGRYQDATVNYLRALEQGIFTEGFSYNLGNVYHALGEPDAALAMWERAASAEDPEIRFRFRFNRGNLYYELGRYRDAYNEFRKALEIDSTSVEAKINLELSLLKIQAYGVSAESVPEERPQADRQESRETERMLEYVRRKEGQRWSASQPQADSADVEDW